MAQKKRKRKSKRTAKPEPYPGWMWLLFGLGIGLSVAFAIFMKDRATLLASQPVTQNPASMAAPLEAEPEPAPAATTTATPAEEEPAEDEPRFTFYNMLPNFEVVIPEEEPDVSRDAEVEPIEAPGTYVLQAGSFTDVADADRRRAELALLGLESRVQRITIDERTYHRVRIGPMSNLDELNRVRSQLREARIDVLRIKLVD